MDFERKVIRVGSSLAIVIPNDVVKYMNLDEKTEILIRPEEGKHGKFVAFWRKDQQNDINRDLQSIN